MAQLFAGTSGFAYAAWKPQFYPANVPAKKFLAALRAAPELRRDQLHVSPHALGHDAGLVGGADAAGFRLRDQGHMRITHVLRLKNAGEATDVFLRSIDPLRSARRLGPVLFQLPPDLKCDVKLLADFLALLPADLRFAFEFRHDSWLNDEVYGLLRERNVSLCVAESEKLEVPEVITADFVYYRLRKPEYTEEDLEAIEARTRELLAEGRDLYLMFKHEDTPEGALNAEKLLRRIEG